MADEQARVSPFHLMGMFARRPGMFVALTTAYIGIALVALGESGFSFSQILERYGISRIVGLALVTGSMIYLMASMLNAKRESRFIDIDDKARSSTDRAAIEKLIGEIEHLKRSQPEVDYNRIEDLIRKAPAVAAQNDPDLLKSFEGYFNSIRSTLEEKAAVADQKASVLLDKGTAYSKGGIAFFIFSIVAWQALSWIKGFEDQFIYGIVSCSVLFVFIEFLSAWFLKQYRQFVDTSTYLIKVKSIFDRYMLSYLIAKEVTPAQPDRMVDLLSLLKEDIKWPETYLLKSGDISFARETMETMTYLLKTLKETAKDTKDK